MLNPPFSPASPNEGNAPVVATAPSPALIGELGHLFNAEVHVGHQVYNYVVSCVYILFPCN